MYIQVRNIVHSAYIHSTKEQTDFTTLKPWGTKATLNKWFFQIPEILPFHMWHGTALHRCNIFCSRTGFLVLCFCITLHWTTAVACRITFVPSFETQGFNTTVAIYLIFLPPKWSLEQSLVDITMTHKISDFFSQWKRDRKAKYTVNQLWICPRVNLKSSGVSLSSSWLQAPLATQLPLWPVCSSQSESSASFQADLVDKEQQQYLYKPPITPHKKISLSINAINHLQCIVC